MVIGDSTVNNTEPSLVAIDWGTSSFRLWVLNSAVQVLDTVSGPFGMANVAADAFNEVLESKLQELQIAVDVPVIICGMAGAAQGWIDAGYVTVPNSLSAIAQFAVDAPGTLRNVKILPGAASALDSIPDVMRGEETILMGALLAKTDGTVCLPGTHSKWAKLENGVLTSFTTALTGELFALLQTNSTLSPYLQNSVSDLQESSGANNEVYCQAVEQSLTNPEKTLQHLFSIRAAGLRLGRNSEDSSAALSGYLIGLEIAGMRSTFTGPITLISGEPQRSLYTKALQLAGLNVNCLSSEETVRAGLAWAANVIWPHSTNTTINKGD